MARDSYDALRELQEQGASKDKEKMSFGELKNLFKYYKATYGNNAKSILRAMISSEKSGGSSGSGRGGFSPGHAIGSASVPTL